MLDCSLVMRALRLLSLLLLTQCAFAAGAARPNILLVTIDTTRADRMGFLGSQRGLTPNLDKLAKQSVVFSRAYSQVPLTVPSHTTILTGTYPQFHQVVDFGLPVSKDLPYLPQILHAHGYRTAAFVGAAVLDPKGGWAPGIDRGFDTYNAGFGANPGEPEERRAEEVVSRALAWLKTHPRGPWFVWVHVFDPHTPYDPPEPFKTRYASEPYDGEIAYTDSELGKLFDHLRARGTYQNTLIAVMADHGEAFGEHGERTHGIFLYDETIHVPLLFKLPGQRFAGERVQARAQLVDVAPTLLKIAGLPAPKSEQGVSLLAVMKPQSSVPERPAYSETDYPHRDFGWSALRALRSDKYLFVQAPRKELYDQTADPKAEHNLASSSTAVAQTLNDKLDSLRRQTANSAAPGQVEIDPRLAERLAALGYAAGGHVPQASGSEMTGADPKDKIEIANAVQESLMASQQGRAQDAIRILEQLQAKDAATADVAVVQRTLGSAYLQQEDYDKALPALRKAVALNPDFSLDHYRLGQALFAIEDYDGARKELQIAIEKSSLVNLKYAGTLHFFLAAIHRKMGKAAEGIKELQVAEQVDPGDYQINLTLGRLLSMDGQASSGLPYLKKAAELEPKSPEPHLFLADAYSQLGQEDQAMSERMQAGRLQGLQKP